MKERRPNGAGSGGEFDVEGRALDDVFEALANPRRRRIVSTVVGDAPQTLDDLATTLAADAGDDERDVHLSLRHVHVPKLVDCDVLAYDAEGALVPGERAAPALAAIEEVVTTIAALDAMGGDSSEELYS